MRRRRLPILASLLIVAGLGLPSWGGALDAPRGYSVGRGDGQLVQVITPDGRLWSAWAYDAGAENDIAVAVRSVDGVWSEPVFLGSGNGLDEGFPALAVDGRGTLYLAFAVRNGAWIGLSVSPAGSGAWSAPGRVSPAGEFASRPSVRVIADRLVLAYRTAGGTALLDFPLLEEDPSTQGIQDGPDILPPTGNNSSGGTTPGGSPFAPKR